MNVETIAVLYVNVIEPAAKLLGFAVLAIVVLYFFNAMKDAKKKSDFINNSFHFIINSSKTILGFLGRMLLGLLRGAMKIVTLLIAVVRDFLTSKWN